jgi:uncharacterized 2Fe-2S/4Fe-4S cluster protein (DUF4445 family)
MADPYKITFLPMEKTVSSGEGETLLETAMAAGIHINASCGGNGICGKCRVKIRAGACDAPSHPRLSREEYDAGLRLACLTMPRGDMVVEIPLESQVDRATLKKDTLGRGALRRDEKESHVLSATALDRLVRDWSVDPAVFKKYVELPPPSAEDNINDFGRLARELKKSLAGGEISANLNVLKGLAGTLREAEWRVTATLVGTDGSFRLVNIEAGNREDWNYSVVIDIGTTTVWGQVLDLAHCAAARACPDGNAALDAATGAGTEACTCAESADFNSQISYGEDVISRILYARKPGGLDRLRDAVVSTINGILRELEAASGVGKEGISHMVLAGNTTMTHLALGLDPTYLMLSPYTPTSNFYPPVRAKDLGINVADHVFALFFPSVASYVGGDIVAGVLGSGMFRRDEIALFLDIGTNGEIVVGNREWLTCASCSAGPAFEGGGIQFGMRAGRGAIEKVRVSPSTFEPMLLTIGRTPPAGICGSGLIDLAAEFFETGIIDQNGKFRRDLPTARVRPGETGAEYVLSYADETSIGRDITVSEADLDNLIRTKAAIYAGCKTLLGSVGLSFEDVGRIIIAGGFGRHLDIERAQTIGLLPDVPSERFIFVGNGSLLGARLLSFSKELLDEAQRIARSMTNVELSNNTSFMDEFVAALFIPHTDERAFPHVLGGIRER